MDNKGEEILCDKLKQIIEVREKSPEKPFDTIVDGKKHIVVKNSLRDTLHMNDEFFGRLRPEPRLLEVEPFEPIKLTLGVLPKSTHNPPAPLKYPKRKSIRPIRDGSEMRTLEPFSPKWESLVPVEKIHRVDSKGNTVFSFYKPEPEPKEPLPLASRDLFNTRKYTQAEEYPIDRPSTIQQTRHFTKQYQWPPLHIYLKP